MDEPTTFEVQQREAFDAVAQRYDGRWMRTRWPRNVATRCTVLESALGSALEEGPVVEVGCGSAQMAEMLLDRHPGLRWVGLDLSEEMVAIAQQRLLRFGLRAEVRLVPGALGLEDKVFAGGFGVDVLHHINEPVVTLGELCRALTPGAPAVFLEANPRFPVTTMLGLLQKHERNVLRISRTTLQKWFMAAGFRAVHTSYGPTYTPPAPSSVAPVLDRVDAGLARVPGFRTLALHVVASGSAPQ